MVSLSMTKNQGVQVALPTASSAASLGDQQEMEKAVTLSVNGKGDIFYNKEKITIAQLPLKLQTLKATSQDPKVILNSDADADFKHVVAVLDEVRKIGIGKVVLRDREDLVALFPHDKGLVLQKLHYPHELRQMGDVPEIEGPSKLDKNELKLATTLVEQMATSLSEIDTTDNYHEALKKLIDSKIKGKKTVEFEQVEEIPRLDIMSALKKSLQQSNRKPMVKAPSVAKKKPQITLVKSEAKSKAVKRRKAS